MNSKLLRLFALLALSAFHLYGQQKNNLPTETETLQKIPGKVYSGLKAGDIAPDVVKVDADNFVAIINGVCIIQKCQLFALIDLKGNFLAPWGKYVFYNIPGETQRNLLISVSDPTRTKYGYLNTKGNVAIPLIFTGAGEFNAYRLAHVSDIHYKGWILDAAGTLYPNREFRNVKWNDLYARNLYNRPQAYDHMAVLVSVTTKKGASVYVSSHWGFGDKTGTLTIPAIYDDCSNFSEGMAAVAQVDKFGIKRWGFIDGKGKLVIPYTYQNRPGSFHNGLAMITPVQETDFDYGYINKQGDIKIKIVKQYEDYQYRPAGADGVGPVLPKPLYNDHDQEHFNDVVGNFINGYSIWNGYHFKPTTELLDTLGHFHHFQSIIKDPAIKAYGDKLLTGHYDDLGIYYEVDAREYGINNKGLVNYNGNTIYPPAYSGLNADFYSGYALADRFIPDASGKPKRVFGVINAQGVFVMTIADKPTF